jgi:hypothetical protein
MLRVGSQRLLQISECILEMKIVQALRQEPHSEDKLRFRVEHPIGQFFQIALWRSVAFIDDLLNVRFCGPKLSKLDQ